MLVVNRQMVMYIINATVADKSTETISYGEFFLREIIWIILDIQRLWMNCIII